MKRLKIMLLAGCLCLVLFGCSWFCEHTYHSAVTQEATCALEGVETFTCTRCAYSYTAPIPRVEHTLDQGTVEQQSTCSEEGIIKHACVACEATVTLPLEKLPHTPGEFTVTKEPNCSEKGERTASCTECEAVITQELRTNGIHQMVNQVIRDATCIDHGEGVDVCSLCQFKQACGYPLKEHTFGAASCGSAGTCTVCGIKGATVGHSYVVTQDRKPSGNFAGRKDRVCSACGAENTLYYTESYSYDLDAIYNELVSYAMQRGFKITTEHPGIMTNTHYSYSQSTTFLDLPGEGPERLLTGGKSAIDKAYAYCSGRVDLYTAYIYANYGQTGSSGTASFAAGIYLSF